MLSTRTYYQHFRLKGPPFEAASPSGAVYFSPTHLQGLATLESGLSQDLKGFTLLTGEPGTGKTTLIYSLLRRDYKRVRIAHIDNPKLSFPEIMRVILAQFKLYSTGSTKLDYVEALDRFLEIRDSDERIAIILDEAQLLGDDVLEELRLVSNHLQSHNRRLQLILVGQPELAERLKKPELRQLNQCISSRGVLKALNAAQAIKYVEYKLGAQGGKCSAIFERSALKRLLQRSDGLPRKINTLCHSAMLAAYSAGEKKISARTARKLAAEYHDSVIIRGRGFSIRLVPAFIVGTALALILLLAFAYPNVSLDWAFNSKVPYGGSIEKRVRPIKPVKQTKRVEQQGVGEHSKLEADHRVAARRA
jgi:general secretion pathway protein A